MSLPEIVNFAITAPAALPRIVVATNVRVRSKSRAPSLKDHRPQGSYPRAASADIGQFRHELEAAASHERSTSACPGDRFV